MTRRYVCNPTIPEARRINAEPWDPLPGMVKRQCDDCEFWFATANRGQEYCPDCQDMRRRGHIYGQARKRPL
jgi:ribosomal protein L36